MACSILRGWFIVACLYKLRLGWMLWHTSVHHYWILLSPGDSCISWLSKNQPQQATSSYEAEYRVTFIVTVECVWLRRLLVDLLVLDTRPPLPYSLRQPKCIDSCKGIPNVSCSHKAHWGAFSLCQGEVPSMRDKPRLCLCTQQRGKYVHGGPPAREIWSFS